ncbi:hypothetical protein GCK32_017594, partial [Trichostrongylus colubriformis]
MRAPFIVDFGSSIERRWHTISSFTFPHPFVIDVVNCSPLLRIRVFGLDYPNRDGSLISSWSAPDEYLTMERLGQFPLCVPLLQGLRPPLPPWLPLAFPSMPSSLQNVLPPSAQPASGSVSVTTATEETTSYTKSETTDEAASGTSPTVEVAACSTSPIQRPTIREALSRPDSAESSILSE